MLQDISQIIVQYTDGSEEVYRGKGIEKLKRKLGASQPKLNQRVVIEDDDNDSYTEVEECTGDFCPVPQPRSSKKSTKRMQQDNRSTVEPHQPLSTSSHGGIYHRSGVNYKPTGGNIMEIAKNLSQQSGLKFNT